MVGSDTAGANESHRRLEREEGGVRLRREIEWLTGLYFTRPEELIVAIAIVLIERAVLQDKCPDTAAVESMVATPT